LIPSITFPVDEFPKREITVCGSVDGFDIVLRRNCSISPVGLARVFLALALVSLLIAGGFATVGAWLVLPFAGVEVVLLGVSFVMVARHAVDQERIELRHDKLTVEVVDGTSVTRMGCDRRWARVRLEERGGVRVLLGMHGNEVEIGRHLDARSRIDLAGELRRRLGN